MATDTPDSKLEAMLKRKVKVEMSVRDWALISSSLEVLSRDAEVFAPIVMHLAEQIDLQIEMSIVLGNEESEGNDV